MQSLFEDPRVHQDSNSQSGSSLGSVKVHSFTLSYILGSMKCDSRASLLARTLASPCLGCEPKARVTTNPKRHDGHDRSRIKCGSYVFTITGKIINIKYFSVAIEVCSLVSLGVGPLYITFS